MAPKQINILFMGGFPVRIPNAFAAVIGRRKNKATGDRPLNRSKYEPHQGEAEKAARRRGWRKAA